MNHVLSICWVIPLYPGGFVIHKFRWCRTCQRWAYGMWAMAFLWSSLDALNRPGASDTFRCHPRLGNSPRMGKILENCRRKFRSQTSDNMDRWKAEQGRGREKRKIIREKSRRERVRRKKMQMREKVGKSRNIVFFQWFVAPEGRKVGSLKRRVRSQLARWEMKNCTPLWREARFEVKMYKTHHCRTTFGSWDVEKVHAAVARSTFRSEYVQKTPFSDHSLEVEMSKKCFAVVARQLNFQVKMYKTHTAALDYTTLDSTEMYDYTSARPLHWRDSSISTRSHYTTFH